MSEPPRVRVRILRSTGDYSHLGAEVEAAIDPGVSAVESLTTGYEIVAGWLDLAQEAERLARAIASAKFGVDEARERFERAKQTAVERPDDFAEHFRTLSHRGLEEREAEYQRLVASRAELVARMRDPEFAVLDIKDAQARPDP